jgi:nucleoside-diphosphate-sugar epimerase
MDIFVTGATGFIGGRLVRKLIARGDSVVCLVRDPAKADQLRQLGARLVRGDIREPGSLAGAMAGAAAVVHLAASLELGRRHARLMRAINVDGTRNVLGTAVALGVPRIVYTSTIAVFGNTHGAIVDETYRCGKEQLTSAYERTKWEAHYDIAVPLQQRGAPIVIVQPGGVTGAGDTGPHMPQIDFYLRRVPVGVGASSGYTWAHVDDVADGHLLALERGAPGEAYILAGPAMTWKQAMELWAQITGIPAPKLWTPAWMVPPVQGLLDLIERAGASLPVSAEGLGATRDYTYWASADKARRELGWTSRPAEETFREVLAYELKRRGAASSPGG